MHLLPRIRLQAFIFNNRRLFTTTQMTSSSIQSGSYVTHPSLYANKSREELLARIAELERAHARVLISHSKDHGVVIQEDATAAAGSSVASTSTSTFDHRTHNDNPTTATSITAAAGVGDVAMLPTQQTKAERKLLKKKARLSTPTGQSNNTSTGSLTGESFFERYGSRKIALRFCYEGWLHGGLAVQDNEPPSGIYLPPAFTNQSSSSSNTTHLQSNKKDASSTSNSSGAKALPTVEGVLLDALVASRLIRDSDKRNFEALDFSRCGRTDRGVSAAGQVISLYVRSQLNEKEGCLQPGWRSALRQPEEEEEIDLDTIEDLEERKKIELKRNKKRDELPYMSLLNRVLPNSIRILGWSSVDASFDARFSCKYRHYKYFFTAPRSTSTFSSPSASIEESGTKENVISIQGHRRHTVLDVRRMQDAANRLVGEHDFRNLCKVDATKQITNFYRHVMSASISPVSNHSIVAESHDGSIQVQGGTGNPLILEDAAQEEEMYVFNLRGSAFLYHQVRHIMAVLFLVGSGHEDPSVIDALLNTGYPSERAPLEGADVDNTTKGDQVKLPTVTSKPAYEMASDLPLVLWDSSFKEDSNLRWQQDELIKGQDLRNSKGYLEMKYENTQLRIKEAISSHFMKAFLETGNYASSSESSNDFDEEERNSTKKEDIKKNMFEIQLGGGKTSRAGKYTPLLERGRSDSVEVVNERWAMGQGKRRTEKKARELAQTGMAVD